MTAYSTLTLLATTTHGTPAGNYDGSSQDFVGNAVPAANYYGGQGSVQTVTYRLENFVGTIHIEATLNDQKESAPWFEVAVYGNGVDADSGTVPATVVGNFTWLRARITDFADGTIQSINVAY
jgi:hypothetical protein